MYGFIDLVSLALQLGATFMRVVFRDKKQLEPLIKAAISHRGFAFIDAISPASPLIIIRALKEL